MNRFDIKRYSTLYFRIDVAKVFYTMLFVGYLSLFDISFMANNLLLSEIATGIGLFSLLLIFQKIRKEFVPIYVFIGLVPVYIFLSSFMITRLRPGFGVVLIFLSNAGIALMLLRGYIYSWGGYIVFYGLSAYCLWGIIAGTPIQTFSATGSFNSISIILLQNCIPLYLALSVENKKLDLIPVILTLVISIWGRGTSGVLSSSILFIGLFFIYFKFKPKYVFISIIIYLFLSYLFLDIIIKFVFDYLNARATFDYLITKETMHNERMYIWSNYFSHLDLLSILFGTDLFRDNFMGFYLYNYHNSYIALHSQAGFIGIIIFALICFSLFKFYRTNHIFFFLLLSITLRSMTDVGNFFTLGDFIFYFFIFDVITSELPAKKET